MKKASCLHDFVLGIPVVLIQMPFRVPEELKMRIHRALGREMTRTGRKLTANEFLRVLIEKSLSSFE